MNLANRIKYYFFRLLKLKFLAIFVLPLPQVFYAQPTSQTFNASGTYIVPSGYTANVTIQAWGGGGGGGSNTSGAKGGGGGGAYASRTTTLTAGSYAVTVGTGGGAGSNGGNSSFTTLVVAQGGFSTTGRNGGSGGRVAGSVGTTRIAGVNGSNASGNNGGAGGAGGNGGGSGGAGGVANNGSGSAGTAPGGGGGGKAGPGNTGNSGAGANGRVVVTVNVVIPVKFGNISAFEKQGSIQLNWTTYTEENLDKYQVERSYNGTNFLPIGTVAALNLFTGASYTFIDNQPFSGDNFYRIRTINLDGKEELSMVIRISRRWVTKDLLVYPNPVQDRQFSWRCHLEKGIYEIKLFKNTGQEVLKQKLEHSGGIINQVVPLSPVILPGRYLLRIAGEGIVKTKNIVVL